MIPNATMDVKTLDSNFEGESIDMEVDPESLRHLMAVLTDLYTDTIGACIREYSTNARDSHIEAGKADVPIEVTTPSRFSPVFKVRDYGVGLSIDDIRKVYSKYGASTKRESNDVNGMIGVGAKAALTYTSSFTVAAVKDGNKVIVSVGRNPEGGGTMEIVDNFPTDEPNGVEIQIPVALHDTTSFKNKTLLFFNYWDAGTVRVDGRLHDGFDKSPWTQMDDDGKLFFSNNTHDGNTIVMGGVAYDVPYESPFPRFTWNVGFTYFADMGEVTFAPSRESLVTNNENRAVFDRIVETLRTNARKKANEKVEAAASVREALNAAREASRDLQTILGTAPDVWEYDYKGSPLSDRRANMVAWLTDNAPAIWVDVPNAGAKVNVRVFTKDELELSDGNNHYSRSAIEGSISAQVVVTGAEAEAVTNSSRRTVAMRGLRHLGHIHERVVFTSAKRVPNYVLDIIGSVKIIKWESVAEASKTALKQQRQNAPKVPVAKAKDGLADVIINIDSYAKMSTKVEKIDPKGDNVVYLGRGDVRTGEAVDGYNPTQRARRFRNIMDDFPDITFVAVPNSKQEDFKRNFPNAISFSKMIVEHSGKTFVDKAISIGGGKVTEATLSLWINGMGLYSSHHYAGENCVAMVDQGLNVGDTITNYTNAVEAQKETVRVAEEVVESFGNLFNRYTFMAYMEKNHPVDDNDSLRSMLDVISSKYPLLTTHFDRNAETLRHLAIYVAAVDAQA